MIGQAFFDGLVNSDVGKQDVVIFDGTCGVCSALKRAVQRRDEAGTLTFVAYQRGNLDEISPGLTPEMASRSVYFVSRDGRRFHGARAVFETMRRLPGGWGVVGTILAFPPLSLLAEPIYRLVARNRGLISRRLGLTHPEIPRGEGP